MSDARLQQATAFHQQNQLDAAERLYREVIAGAPDHAEAMYLLGTLLTQRGASDEAVELFDRALAINPGHVVARISRGNALLTKDRATEALADFDEALSLMTPFLAALNSRGGALRRLGRLEEAVSSFDLALSILPNSAMVQSNRGVVLRELGRLEESLAAVDQAIRLQPQSATFICNRGDTLRELERFAKAVEDYDRALALQPNFPDALIGRGLALMSLHKLDEAQASFQAALALQPDDAKAHFDSGLCSLLAGDLAKGFAGYEARWRNAPNSAWKRDFAQPLWLGKEDIAGKTILLHGEQGLGDSIQFCRYATLAAARGARVILEVPAPLKRLMSSLAGPAEVVAFGDALPAFDLHCPLMSLPLAFGTTAAQIPAAIPYLTAESQAVKRWQERLGPQRKRRIGLVWSGGRLLKNDRNRSVSLPRLAPLLKQDLEFVSLQKELRSGDAEWLAAAGRIAHFGADQHDFAETAALVSLMDGVVSVDTSVAHLAGAMGKTVYVLLPKVGVDWRWMLEREDTPWYPTARLFRQPSAGDWDSVVARVGAALAVS